ncbi:MAG: TIGR03118 family protein [Acidobacteriota bacterium]|nr:TIGR03118 family protein [Acidobacteriota bacterium]
MVNPWGICTSAASPFWISDNKTGLSTLYTSFGVPNATTKPVVPATRASAAPGSPTGCVNNGTATAFLVPDSGGRSSSFIFDTEEGSISGWSSAVNAGQAIVMVDNSAKGAVYKGLAIATPSTAAGPRLYAANFNAGTIEVYDQNWQPVSLPGAFTDPAVPTGFAPFNIQALGGKLYATYAKQDAKKHDDVPGAGNGYVAVYDLNGALLMHLVSGGNLNSPWGVAIAPAGFGDLAGNLLVGNFGDGVINAYNQTTGALVASLQDTSGKTIHISGLWGLQPGNGGNGGDVNAVYFAAGTGGETHGLFGSLQAAPVVPTGAVVNSGSYAPVIAPGGFATVSGLNLGATQRIWATADFMNGKLPTTIDGITATVDGKPAYIYYVSPSQINLIPAADATQGSVPVVISNNGLVSATTTATLATYAPAFFIAKSNYIAATHADGTLVGPATLFPNNSSPAKAGETIVLYATGLGPVNPVLEGMLVTSPAPVTTTLPTVTFNGAPATVTYSGLSSSGLNQINVTVPSGTASGDQTVVLTIGGAKSQSSALINVQ